MWKIRIEGVPEGAGIHCRRFRKLRYRLHGNGLRPATIAQSSLCSQKIRPPQGLSAGVEKPRLVESEGKASPSEPRIEGSPGAGLMPDSAQIGVAMVKSATQNRIHHILFVPKGELQG